MYFKYTTTDFSLSKTNQTKTDPRPCLSAALLTLITHKTDRIFILNGMMSKLRK